MSSKSETKTEKKTSKPKTNKSTAQTQYQYAYVFNGGVLKQNHCIVGVSSDHPETTVFNELKKYYGNDIKGAFYKCAKSSEDIKAGIKYKLSDTCLTEILYNKNFSETKKVLLDVTGLKQCSGTINVYKEKVDTEAEAEAEEVQADKPETNAEDSDDESEKEEEKVIVAKGKSKAKKETEPETKSKSKGKETIEKETKSDKKTSKSTKKV